MNFSFRSILSNSNLLKQTFTKTIVLFNIFVSKISLALYLCFFSKNKSQLVLKNHKRNESDCFSFVFKIDNNPTFRWFQSPFFYPCTQDRRRQGLMEINLTQEVTGFGYLYWNHMMSFIEGVPAISRRIMFYICNIYELNCFQCQAKELSYITQRKLNRKKLERSKTLQFLFFF